MSMHTSLKARKKQRARQTAGQARSAPRKRACQLENARRLAEAVAVAGLDRWQYVKRRALATAALIARCANQRVSVGHSLAEPAQRSSPATNVWRPPSYYHSLTW